jgi:phenylacetate-CoA ligase
MGESNYTLSVIAPALNEAPNLPNLVERLNSIFEARGLRGQVVLVDDGSTDETPRVMDELARDNRNVIAVHHEENRGIAAAWQTGLEASSGKLVCLIDSDLQYVPEDVWRLYRESVQTPDDVVQGYRSSLGWNRGIRYRLSRGLNLMVNLLFGTHLRDAKSGFILCRREVLEDILDHKYRYHYFQTFIAIAAVAKGYSVRETEVIFEQRLAGTSFISGFPIKIIFGSLIDLTKGFFEFRLRRFRRLPFSLEPFLSRVDFQDRSPKRALIRRIWFRIYVLLMPLHHWFVTRRAVTRYREMRRSQWLSPEDVTELQELKLRKLIHHAYGHVAYYRELFDSHGIKPGDIETLEDLQRLPMLTKGHVREYLFFDLLSDNHDKRAIQRIATSGSTGEPFVCYVDRHQLEMRWAATLRSMEWTGWSFGDRQVRLWHQTIGMTRMQTARERLDAFLQRRKFIPAFEMSDSTLGPFVQQIVDYKPSLIDGYAESLNFLAQYLKDNEIDGVAPNGIISSAQNLPRQSREIIEREFETRVFDKYGAREFSGIAYECDAHTHHHVLAENYAVEVIKDGRPAKPGEIGEVVITDLNNYCLPFIRYRIGDLAVAVDPGQRCPCGRGLPMIGSIEGRVQSIILASNGRYLPSSFFLHFFKDYDHIVRQFQVVQERADRIQLKIVKAPRFDESTQERMIQELRQFVGEEMEIKIEYVDVIPMVRTGKRQGSVSKLDLEIAEEGAAEAARLESSAPRSG